MLVYEGGLGLETTRSPFCSPPTTNISKFALFGNPSNSKKYGYSGKHRLQRYGVVVATFL
jgi:hypothetical protein